MTEVPDDVDLSDPEQAVEWLNKEWVEHIEDEHTTGYVGMARE